MSTYVLVHGAWQGGWTWRRVATQLRARGHEVLTPTLTGLGDRAHLLTRTIGLEQHVQDVVMTLECERLTDIVLVGHSYAGQVIATVASLRPELIGRLVYVDAFLPDNRQSATEEQPPKIAQVYREAVVERGAGWLIPPRPLHALGVTDPEDVAWLEPLMVPHPYRTFNDGATVTERSLSIPAGYIECVDGLGVFAAQRAKAERRGWPVRDLRTGHQAMTTAPGELVELMEELGGS